MGNNIRILIVDDEDVFREDLAKLLREDGFEVETAKDGFSALEKIKKLPDIVLLDLYLPKMSGIELLKKIKDEEEDISVIVITAYANIENVIESFREGALDYITKPINYDELLLKIKRVGELKRKERESLKLRRALRTYLPSYDIVGESEGIKKALELAKMVAPTKSSVLLIGETGVGKELFARYIHKIYQGEENSKPFIAINCGGIPENLLEVELFGCVKGAFTGADSDRPGLIEIVGDGTLFLDEISELPLPLQPKLLRVLDTREFMRVGGRKVLRFEGRVISATNKNLRKFVEEGKFREDLYYRISSFEIYIPPLRERREDIPLIVNFLIKRLSRDLKKPLNGITEKALTILMSYGWPGNVRELRNVIERAIIIAQGDKITERDIILDKSTTESDFPDNLKDAVKEFEKWHIKRIINVSRDLDEASRKLGIDRSTLYRKMKELGIR